MHEHEPLNPALQAFEARLAALHPASGLNREQVMYEAGRAAGAAGLNSAGRRWAWPSATLLIAVAALLVGRWTAAERAVDSVQVVAFDSARPITAAQSVGEQSPSPDCYVRLRGQLSADAFAYAAESRLSPGAATPASRDDLLHELLN